MKRPGQDVFVEYRSQEIRDYIDAHPEYDNIVIVLSGGCGILQRGQKTSRSTVSGQCGSESTEKERIREE